MSSEMVCEDWWKCLVRRGKGEGTSSSSIPRYIFKNTAVIIMWMVKQGRELL